MSFDTLVSCRGQRDLVDGNNTMRISFNFDPEKTLQVVAFFLRRAGGPIDKAKLMKLVYLSDRAHFIEFGVPLTGDRQYAMKWGPVPSRTLDLIDGECDPANESVYNTIQLNNFSVSLAHDPGEGLLSTDEKTTMDRVWQEHGHKQTIPLCHETHRLPEYKAAYVEGTSKPIDYEQIAKYSNNPARYWLGRPVISPQTAAAMPCPFPPETDL
jgi:uncharacterized phage-associated protein